MSYRIEIDDLNVSKEARTILALNLEKIRRGSDQVLLTPMGERNGPDNILKQWDEIYQSNFAKINHELQEVEMSNRSKFGPRSIAKPWVERKSNTLAYFGPDNTKEVRQNFTDVGRQGRLTPLSTANALEYLKNSTNSGLPFMVKKGRVKEEVLNNFDYLIERRDPCVLFTRTQESNKTRDVWGYPVADTLNEMRYYRPLLEFQKRQPWRQAVNKPEDVDRSITNLIIHAQTEDLSLVSLDFSSYDATVKKSIQTSCFDYIKYLFQSKYASDIDYIADRFNTIGLVTPDGVIEGSHGVPSGSTFTNEVDSIAQFIVSREFEERLQFSQIQGDDGAYACSDGEELMEHFRSFGFQVNAEKTQVKKDSLVFLQMLYHPDYNRSGIISGIYPTYRALIRLVYPERFEDFSKEDISGKDYFALRTISILENCKHHPLFREFVEFIATLDKYSLIPSDEGLKSYVKMRLKQDGKDINFQSHLYGTEISGIRRFETFKILKEINI